MTLTTRCITLEENGIWDQLVNSSPQGSVFLLSDCLYAYVANGPELHLLRLGCFDNHNNLIGGQAFIHKKKAGVVRVQTHLYTWDYFNTPIIAGHVSHGSLEYCNIMQALADKVKKSFLYYKVVCHPSIQDVRPLLQNGWSATPYYAHMWDLRNPETLLKDLKEKKRFRQAESIFQCLNFANETGETVIQEFIPLYKETAQNIGYRLSKSWEQTFQALTSQMIDRNAIRFITCRKKSGEILSIATYVLNPVRHTAYGWQLAHIRLQNEKDFIPAHYIYAIKILSNDATYIDIAEGVRPSLYYFKDSLGTRSIPLFSVETPNSEFWKKLLSTARKAKRSADNLAH